MTAIESHPTVQAIRLRNVGASTTELGVTREALLSLAREVGADDAGVVRMDRPELDDQRADILAAFPRARTLLSVVTRMNREPIRSPHRGIANLEFHGRGEDINEVTRKIVAALEARGIPARNPAMGFPMEMDRFPNKTWSVSHKPVAEAAGLGRMGLHRNLIHPRFGSFVLLSTVVIDAPLDEQDRPIDYDPCVDCKLCVAACPVGAIGPDGHFDFSSCYTHNYREFMSGFTTWVEEVADSKDARDYRQRVTDSESASMWQSLSFGANYKAAYCLGVCPAGEHVMAPFLEDRKGFLEDVVKPLTSKQEVVYVVPGSDAEQHVAKRFPHKEPRQVSSGLRPDSVDGFAFGLGLTFQRGQAKGMNTTYHFRFTGAEEKLLTVEIRDQQLAVASGLEGEPDLVVTADTATWLGFLAKDRSLPWALLTRRIKLRGSPQHLLDFAKCFPS